MQQTIDKMNAELIELRSQQQQQATSSSTALTERIEELERNLVQAQQETETIRATVSINQSLGSMSAENGDKSISDQLTERVEEIRAELESRHNERVAQLEENYDKRVDGMRKQLSTKLAEGREKARQSLVAENERAIQVLKSAHEHDLEKLQTQHQSELAELKQSEESRFSQFKDAWKFEHPAAGGTDPLMKSEDRAAKPMAEVSEADAKVLLETNALLRKVFKSNVDKKLNEAKEAVALQLREEHERDLADRLAEAQSKASTAKEHAVSMEQKRNQIKLSMSDNKAKVAQAKVGVVQTAASDTPQKPVVDVWEIAKNAKPEIAVAPSSAPAGIGAVQQPASNLATEKPAPPLAQNTQIQGQKSTPGVQTQPQKPPTTSFGQPSGLVQGAQVPGPKPFASPIGQPSGFGQPTSFGQPSHVLQNTQSQGQKPAPVTSFGQPSSKQDYQTQVANTQAVAQQPPAQQKQNTAPPGPAQQRPSIQSPNRTVTSQPATNQANDAASRQESKPVNGTQEITRQPAASSQPGGIIQQKPQGQNNPFIQGSGAGAARPLQQSNLPVAARGGSSRGGGNPRGRGRGRGGNQSIETYQAQGQQQGRASPTNAGMNPGAKQFVPGNKRPRDEGQEGHHSDGTGNGNGKRIRGGGS